MAAQYAAVQTAPNAECALACADGAGDPLLLQEGAIRWQKALNPRHAAVIPDWRTNCVSFPAASGVTHGIGLVRVRFDADGDGRCRFLPETKDIWCRDYMPVQVDEDTFCQFMYDPDYLRGYDHLKTPPASCRVPAMKKCRSVDLVLDGGNVVAAASRQLGRQQTAGKPKAREAFGFGDMTKSPGLHTRKQDNSQVTGGGFAWDRVITPDPRRRSPKCPAAAQCDRRWTTSDGTMPTRQAPPSLTVLATRTRFVRSGRPTRANNGPKFHQPT